MAPECMAIPGTGLPPIPCLFSDSPWLQTATILALVGDVVWVVAYGFFIWAGFKHKSYAVPILALCLNFSWEFYFTIISPPSSTVVHIAHLAWLVVDVFIVLTVILYGRQEQKDPFLRRWFYPLLAAALAFSFVGQVTFHRQFTQNSIFPDDGGNGMAFMINLVMSCLFLSLFFRRRPGLHGLSYGGAWTRMIGTALISIANTLLFVEPGKGLNYDVQVRKLPDSEWIDMGTVGTDNFAISFYIFMFVTIFLLDAAFVFLLHRARRSPEVRAATTP